MSDEFKLLKQRELGDRAKRLREDELLTQIFEGLKNKYMADWAQSSPLDKETREASYFLLQALLDVRQQLNDIITSGKTAKTFLESAGS